MIPRSDSPHASDGQRPEADVARDDVADLLSDPHCRYLLKYLREEDSPASVATVTQYVVAEITDTAPEDVSDDVQRRVQTWLHHGQLPALAEHGVVEFDAESGAVALADDPWA